MVGSDKEKDEAPFFMYGIIPSDSCLLVFISL
jgi:hypothetical protein